MVDTGIIAATAGLARGPSRSAEFANHKCERYRLLRYIGIIQLLQAEHLIDGVGVQGHAFETRTDAATQKSNLDLLAATGLPIYISELDIDGPTDEVQLADYQRGARAIPCR